MLIENIKKIIELLLQKLCYFQNICEKNNQTSVSDSVREIHILGSTGNAVNSLIPALYVYPWIGISRSASKISFKHYTFNRVTLGWDFSVYMGNFVYIGNFVSGVNVYLRVEIS